MRLIKKLVVQCALRIEILILLANVSLWGYKVKLNNYLNHVYN